MLFLWECLPGFIIEVVIMIIVAGFLTYCTVFLIDDFPRLHFFTLCFLGSTNCIGVYHYIPARGCSWYEGDFDFLCGAYCATVQGGES